MSRRFFYNERNGSQKGPFTSEEIHVLAVRGTLKPKTLIFDDEGKAFDTRDVVDFEAIRKSQKVQKSRIESPASFWVQTSIRILVTLIFLGLSLYYFNQANFITGDATEFGHFQLAAQYTLIAVVSLGFGTMVWFVAKPIQSSC